MRNRIWLQAVGVAVIVSSMVAATPAEENRGYRQPPAAIQAVLDAPLTPAVSLSPGRDWLIFVQPASYPSIAELAAPMLRLAGLRIDPSRYGPHRPSRYQALTLKRLSDGQEFPLAVPAKPLLGFPLWSPDGKQFAFTNTGSDGIELWVGDPQTATVRQIPGIQLNGVMGDEIQWLPAPNAGSLLCLTVPPGRTPPPATRVPEGPVIQESYGKSAPVRTFQDLLQNPHDEALFEHYATSQLMQVDLNQNRVAPVGEPSIFYIVDPSPNGLNLLVSRIRRPYSYLLPLGAFPREVEVWNLGDQTRTTLAKLPLADQVPIEGVPTGPRGHQWMATAPATILWIEALDEGDPKNKVPYRDKVVVWPAPFSSMPREVLKVEHRYNGITWAEAPGQVFLRDYDRDRRWGRTFLLNLNDEPPAPRIVWDKSVQNRYDDPGSPLMRTLPTGRQVMWQQGRTIFLSGAGATPEGELPFLDKFDLTTLKSERLFRCGLGHYEAAVAMLPGETPNFMTRYESRTEPPNYFLRAIEAGDAVKVTERRAVTSFPDPVPQVHKIRKELVSYERSDGVKLSFTMYLPPDYEPGQRRPTLIWAYPLEFNDASTAGQVSGSPNRFTRLSGSTHLFFTLHGYVVLDGATMPVVGDPETANNTFIEQVVESARAAVDKADAMGVTDRNRVGIAGHSYGAFMTANLLAHSDLFKAGIARSGAYNRTLTPFGFQNERRTLWEAPEIYTKVSPFMYAQNIKEPLLLIHGDADNNPGTFPLQTERLYHAVRGNGGNVRYVSLPHESHGYAARESIEHTLYEMLAWFDKYVKGAE